MKLDFWHIILEGRVSYCLPESCEICSAKCFNLESILTVTQCYL